MQAVFLVAALVLVSLPSLASEPASQGRHTCKVAVTTFATQGLDDDEQHLAALLSETVGTEVERVSDCEVITAADISSMLDFDAERKLCDDSLSDSCLSEIGGALDVNLVVAGSIGKLGSLYKAQLRVMDIKNAKVTAREEAEFPASPEIANHEVKGLVKRLIETDALPHEEVARSNLSGRLLIAGIGTAAVGGVAAVLGLGTAGVIELMGARKQLDAYKANARLIEGAALAVGVVGALATTGGIGLIIGSQSLSSPEAEANE